MRVLLDAALPDRGHDGGGHGTVPEVDVKVRRGWQLKLVWERHCYYGDVFL